MEEFIKNVNDTIKKQLAEKHIELIEKFKKDYELEMNRYKHQVIDNIVRSIEINTLQSSADNLSRIQIEIVNKYKVGE